MPHKPPIKPGETLDRYLDRVRREHAAGGGSDELADLFTFYGIDPNSPAANVIRQRIADGESANDVFLEIAALSQTGPFAPTAPTGGAARAFSSTQAAQAQAETFAREQAARDAVIAADAARAREAFEEEQAEIDRELRLREARLATARDLVNIRSAEAREARTQGLQLAGEDIFRFSANVRGQQVAAGTQTPTDVFRTDLTQAAQFQAPDLTGLDTNALESVIGKLSQMQRPAPSPFGFAHGGTVSPGGSSMPGNGSQAIRVGESGPEILILRPDGSVEVVPEAGSAQGGGVFEPLSPEALGGFGPLFRNLRASVGFTTRSPLGGSISGPFSSLRGVLGFRPEGAPEPPITGTAPAFQAFGSPLTIRSGVRDILDLNPGLSPNARRNEARTLSGLIGFLPAPFKIPVSFWQGLVPAEQNALISAYRLAGVPENDFRHLLTAPQLSANPQRATAVG